MARRTSVQIKGEIDKANEALRIFEDHRRLYYAHEYTEGEEEEDLPEKEAWVSRLRSQGVSWSEILSGYQQALNDDLSAFAISDPDAVAYASSLKAYFRERTGKDLFSVFTPPLRKLKAIAKRGQIKNETEHSMVKEFTDHVTDDPVLAELARTLDKCLHDFDPSEQS
jgi:hypothetical protein